jgi:hypothetical protein
MECRLAGETEVLGENLPQSHFCPSQNPTWPESGLNPGRCGGKPTSNRVSYGAASDNNLHRNVVHKYNISFGFQVPAAVIRDRLYSGI